MIKDRFNRKGEFIKILKKPQKNQRSSFIVADIETILIDEKHVPYAAGFLSLNPGDDVACLDKRIETYYSEDFVNILPDFQDRSIKMFKSFLERLIRLVSSNKELKTVYFHNFSRFDGRQNF